MDFIYVFSVTRHEHIKDMFQVAISASEEGLYFVGSKFTDREKATAFAEEVCAKKYDCSETNWIIKVTKDIFWNHFVGYELKYREAVR